MRKSAILSECGTYRHWLERSWGGSEGDPIIFCMLNPSTADADIDDPTIRRCISFASREGFSDLVVVNLFDLRATNPRELARYPTPCSPRNQIYLAKAMKMARHYNTPFVCAWGANPLAAAKGLEVAVNGSGSSVSHLHCLDVTRTGAPRHPLYVRGDQPLVPWPTRQL